MGCPLYRFPNLMSPQNIAFSWRCRSNFEQQSLYDAVKSPAQLSGATDSTYNRP